MSEGSSNKDSDILFLAVFLFLFFFFLFKYVPAIVLYPWSVFMVAETSYIKFVLEYLPQMPFNNIIEALIFAITGFCLKLLVFTKNTAGFFSKKFKSKLVKKVIESKFLFYLYFAFFASTSVLVYFNSDTFYYDVAAINERVLHGSWSSLNYKNMFKVDFFLLPFNASIVVPALMYMASKFSLMPKNSKRHNIESLISNLSVYFGFNRYLITRNPIKDVTNIDPNLGHHGIAFKSNTYLKLTGVVSDVIDKSGEVHCSFIDSRKLYTVFSYQAGPVFTSFEELEERHKWLAVCFALIVMGRRDRADAINYKIGYYYNNREIPPVNGLSWLDDKIRKFKYSVNKDYGRTEINALVSAAIIDINKNKLVMDIAKQHGFVYSLICRLQKEAASKGKTPPNHYYWIYFEDRILGMVVCEQGKPGFSIEAYSPNTIAENEMVSKKPMRMPDISDVVKKLERYLIDEFPVFLYQDEATARIILEQESFKLRESGQLPKYGYWSLRYIKSPNEMPKNIIKENLKYPKNWSEEMKRHSQVANIPEAEKVQ
jgi:hypothetical protein